MSNHKKNWLLIAYIMAAVIVLIAAININNKNEYYEREVKADEFPIVLEKGTYEISIPNLTTSPSTLLIVEDQREYIWDIEKEIAPESIFKSVLIRSTEVHYTDSIYLGILIVLIPLLLVLIWKKNKDNQLILGLLLLLVVYLSVPMFSKSTVLGNDLKFHLSRIDGIYTNIMNGTMFSKINPIQSYGYGYCTPIMYPELFLYPAALLRLCGVSLLLSYKSLIVIIQIVTVYVSYISYEKIMNSRRLGYIATLLYTLCNYRINNVYGRAALGESLAMIFLPLVLWGFIEIINRNEKKWYILAIAITGLLQSHILSFVMAIVFLSIYFLFCIPKFINSKRRFISLLKAASVVFLLNVWFIIPLLEFMREKFLLFHETQRSIHDSSIYLSQLFSISITDSYIGSIGLGATDGEMALSIGIAIPIGMVLYLLTRERKCFYRNYLWVGLTVLLLALNIFPWESVQEILVINKLVGTFQFAYRFLAFSVVLLVIPAALGYFKFFEWILGEKNKWFVIISITSIIFSYSFFQLTGLLHTISIPNKNYVVGESETDQLYLYEGTNRENWKKNENNIIISKDAEVLIEKVTKNGNQMNIKLSPIKVGEGSYLELPLAYYPGYYGTTHKNEEIQISQGNNNVVRVDLPKYKTEISVFYKQSIIWKAANSLSIATLVSIMIYLLRKRRHDLKNQTYK